MHRADGGGGDVGIQIAFGDVDVADGAGEGPGAGGDGGGSEISDGLAARNTGDDVVGKNSAVGESDDAGGGDGAAACAGDGESLDQAGGIDVAGEGDACSDDGFKGLCRNVADADLFCAAFGGDGQDRGVAGSGGVDAADRFACAGDGDAGFAGDLSGVG